MKPYNIIIPALFLLGVLCVFCCGCKLRTVVRKHNDLAFGLYATLMAFGALAISAALEMAGEGG